MAKTLTVPFAMTLLAGLLTAGPTQAQQPAPRRNTAHVGLAWWMGNKTGSW